MRLAWRNLIQERTRLALSMAGVALAILLIPAGFQACSARSQATRELPACRRARRWTTARCDLFGAAGAAVIKT
jgi:hypothetical protein